jgi:hypothetical protein
MAAFGAGVDGWPNSMWMIERPSPFSSWARTLTPMAWNGSISAGMVVGYRETGRMTMRAQLGRSIYK